MSPTRCSADCLSQVQGRAAMRCRHMEKTAGIIPNADSEHYAIFQVISNLLYHYGTCNVVKDILLQRYFGRLILELVESIFCHSLLEKRFDRESLMFVGENSQFHAEAVQMTAKLDR
ncbi:hypothetical protein C2845_PM13G22040 [Panicum miliaceum]|uniref:Uncharacterized protein n=1 Tax=Panicum miliaceum TaxID=4540 RepID=A0A3L6RL28_PANMI|nr:hypothetical protein C2845_PM13G22040 [Panicum miliaceum]